MVRDGRLGRDAALETEEGEVLLEFDADRLYGRCERLRLPDGSEVEVIGSEWGTSGQTTQVLFVDNVE